MKKHLSAFTLTELLVVIILIGILAALAIPRFGKTTDQAMELEATLALEKIYQLQSIYYLKHERYGTDLDKLGFEQEAVVDENGEGRARYLIEVTEADENGYLAVAVPQVKGLKTFEVDQTGKVRER